MRVDHSFEAESDSEISINVGELIHVLEEIDPGWFIGEVIGDEYRSGMFPATYCSVVETPAPLRKPKPPSPTKEDGGGNSGRPSPARMTSSSSSVTTTTTKKKPPPPPVSRGSRNAVGSTTASGSGSGTGGDVRCRECGCDEFRANVFKKGSCNNCFHVHVP
jgi:Variant SH3 domain